MSGQKISVKVIAEAEGKLVIETLDGAQETYLLCPNRTMNLHVDQLYLSNDVTSFHFGEDNLGLPRERPLFVRGTAKLKGGSISVVGDPGNKARTLAIDFYALDDDVWRKHKELAQLMGKAPHYTDARVGLARQRSGIGADDTWFVQCQVPPVMLRALANAVSGGSIASISVKMALRGIYSSGPGVSQTVSSDWFLRPNWRENTVDAPEMACGDITLLNFEETQVDASSAEVSRQPAFGDTTPAPMPT